MLLQYLRLKIVLDLDNTWLGNPPPEVAGDTVGSWPEHTDFPTMEKAYTPPGMGKYLPRKLPLVFEDQKVEKFLTAKSIARNQEIKLDPRAFEPSVIKTDKGTNYHIIDFFARQAILENSVVDTFLEAGIRLARAEDASVDILPVLLNLLKLAWASNLRCRTFIFALFTNNAPNDYHPHVT